MSEMEDYALANGGSSAYRLLPPNPRAYDPSSLEQVYAAAMSKNLTPDNMLGFMVGAQADRQDAGARYDAQLQQANAYQNQIAQGKLAGDRAKIEGENFRQALAHPDQVGMFTAGQRLLAPGAGQRAGELSDASLSLTRSKAFHEGMQGAHEGAEAGVLPPGGTSYTLGGLPTQAPTQGTPMDVQIANIDAAARVASAHASSGGAGIKPRDMLGVIEAQNKIDRDREDTIAKGWTAFTSGMMEIKDRNGNVIQPNKLDARTRQEVISQLTASADRAAQRQHEALRYTINAGGLGRFVPPAPDYNLGAAPAPGAPPANAPPSAARPSTADQTPTIQNGGPVQPTSGNSRGAQQPPPGTPPGRNVGNEGNAGAMEMQTALAKNGAPRAAERAAQAVREAPPGTKHVDVLTNGTIRYRSADNKVLGTAPYR